MKKHLTNPKTPMHENYLLSIYRTLGLAVLLLTLNFSAFASTESLLSERVQLQVDNVTLKDALKEIERQSEFTFLYNDASIDVNQVITVSTKELSVKEVLDAILLDKGINYTIIDNQIVLTKASVKMQDKKTITGTVTDSETGEGLPGVSIMEKGTSNGAVSDMNGNYSLSVAEDAIIVISYVGYVTEEISAAGMNQVSTALVPDIISLEDVVVIGYGTVKKSDVTGAVTKLDEGLMKKTPGIDLNQVLQGKAAGVYITSNSGSPGAGTTARIRGIGTVTNSDPLYVVDGIMLSASEVNFLNSEDIESMQILKDASATAIYGSRGANGVVLVTTKRGKKSEPRVELSYYQGVQNRMQMPDMCNADEFSTITYRMAHPETPDTVVTAPEGSGNTNWFDEVFRQANIRNIYFATTGGSEKSTFHVSASYLDQEGIIINSGFKRMNLMINSRHQVRKWTFGEQILFNNNRMSVVPENEEYSSVMANAISVDPLSVPYINDSTGEQVYGPTLLSNYQNPVATATIGRVDQVNNRIVRGNYDYIQNRMLGTFFAELKPLKFLTLKSQFGGKLNFDRYETFREKYAIETGDENPNSILYMRFINANYWCWENTATYDQTFAEKHHVTLMIGTTAENTFYKWTEAQNLGGPGLENDIPELRYFIYYPDTSDAVNGSAYENSLISYLGRLNYSYAEKYYLTLSLRRDGSSKFGTVYEKNMFNKGQWGTFPSFSVMWRVSNESFFPKTDAFNSLKLRFGWGATGNQNIGNYRFAATVGSQYARYVFDEQGMVISTGAFPYRGVNEALHWETTKQTNIGLDAGFLRDKLTLSTDFFIRKTIDMLWDEELPMSVGLAEFPTQNIGDVKNTGLEVTLGYRQSTGDLSFNLEGNLTYIKNKVTYLNGEDNYLEAGGFGDNDNPFVRIQEGYPIAYFYGYKTDGLFNSWEEVNQGPQPAAFPGDVRFVDLNGDGAITSADRTMIGNPIPKLTYGFNAQVNYKWFDLSIFLQGTYGNDIFFPWIRWIYDGTPNGRNYHTDMLDAWTPQNTDTDIPRLSSTENDNLRWSDMMVYDGSYLRLKTIEFGFTLPESWVKVLTLSNVRIYANGKNLLTFTKYPWFDPEIGRTGNEENAEGTNQYIYGVDYGMYPQSRSIIGGIQITF